MKRSLKRSFEPATFGVGGLLGLALACAPVLADEVEDFYKRKTLTVFVGYSPGGGYDTYSRTVARHIGKHLPGNPRVVVKNRPGAGSMLLTNEVYNTLPKDGSVIAVVGRGMPMEPLFGTKEAQYDPTRFNWIGSANNEVSVCVSWHQTAVTRFDDLLSTGMVVGGTGPGADTDTFPTVLNNVIGTKLKLVTGYPGGNDILLAMERGEVDGRCGYSWSSAKSRQAAWLKEGKMRVLVQMSSEKHPDLPDVPFIMDLARDETQRQVLELIFARQAWGRPFLAPPDVPAARVAALQKAFMATMSDAAFLEEARRQNLEVAPISGDTIERLIKRVYASPQNIIEAATVAQADTKKIQISKASVPIETVDGAIEKVANGGRQVTLGAGGKAYQFSVSGSRTAVMVKGAKAKRDALAAGMRCKVTYQGAEAKEIACN